MSSFTTPLRVEVLEELRAGRVLVRLLESFSYDVGFEGSGETIHIPARYVSDFASIPRGLWNFEPPLGRSGKAAVVHDYLYDTGGLAGRYTRPRSDAIFREALLVLKVPGWKANLMWSAVRAFGGGGWNKG